MPWAKGRRSTTEPPGVPKVVNFLYELRVVQSHPMMASSCSHWSWPDFLFLECETAQGSAAACVGNPQRAHQMSGVERAAPRMSLSSSPLGDTHPSPEQGSTLVPANLSLLQNNFSCLKSGFKGRILTVTCKSLQNLLSPFFTPFLPPSCLPSFPYISWTNSPSSVLPMADWTKSVLFIKVIISDFIFGIKKIQVHFQNS